MTSSNDLKLTSLSHTKENYLGLKKKFIIAERNGWFKVQEVFLLFKTNKIGNITYQLKYVCDTKLKKKLGGGLTGMELYVYEYEGLFFKKKL